MARLVESELPTPWPLGVASLLLTVVSGWGTLTGTATLAEATTRKLSIMTYLGWGFTVIRTLIARIGAVIAIVSNPSRITVGASDGCLALFANLFALMTTLGYLHQTATDAAERRRFAVSTALGRISMFVFAPFVFRAAWNIKQPLGEFTFSNSDCIVSMVIQCAYVYGLIPGCAAPIRDVDGTTLASTFDSWRVWAIVCSA
jgi:hypothetical protein